MSKSETSHLPSPRYVVYGRSLNILHKSCININWVCDENDTGYECRQRAPQPPSSFSNLSIITAFLINLLVHIWKIFIKLMGAI